MGAEARRLSVLEGSDLLMASPSGNDSYRTFASPNATVCYRPKQAV